MVEFHLKVGDRVSFSKTVGESDVYLFAGITGDFARNHIDEEYMKRSPYGRRIAHGALLVGFMSTAATMMIGSVVAKGVDETPVLIGFDRIRFLKPVFLGDTVTVSYVISSIDAERRRSYATIEVANQNGELVAVAKHIEKWLKNS